MESSLAVFLMSTNEGEGEGEGGNGRGNVYLASAGWRPISLLS